MKKLVGDCSGWRMAGEVFLTVIGGDDSRLCHGDDVSAKGSKEARLEGPGDFLRCRGLARTIGEE
jgi:hypothetical protein